MTAKGKIGILGGAMGAATLLCVAGAAVSGYLLLEDFVFGGAELCLTGSGCDVVRESRYSRIGGIPVSLLGLAGYAAASAVVIAPLGRRTKWQVLFWFGASAVGFSAYLTYLELFIIEALCSWCLLSAAIAVTVFSIAAARAIRGSIIKSAAGAGAVILLVFSVSYSIQSPDPEKDATAATTFYQVGLAKYLSERGATMYGSHRCSHCETQKRLFGGAFGLINYVECSRSGPDPRPDLCATKNITSYPTWEIGGEIHQGVRTLDQLGRISGYSGE